MTGSLTTALEEVTLHSQELKKEKNAMKDENTQLKTNIDSLTHENIQLKANNNALRDEVGRLNTENQQLKVSQSQGSHELLHTLS